MSLTTWKEVFYPVDADDASIKTNLDAVRHSIRKWEGLREENRAAHDVCVTPWGNLMWSSEDDRCLQSLLIDSSSCALCEKHDTWDVHKTACQACPLARVRSGVRCDQARKVEMVSPYTLWQNGHDPEPMIEALKKAEAVLMKDQQRKKNAR